MAYEKIPQTIKIIEDSDYPFRDGCIGLTDLRCTCVGIRKPTLYFIYGVNEKGERLKVCDIVIECPECGNSFKRRFEAKNVEDLRTPIIYMREDWEAL